MSEPSRSPKSPTVAFVLGILFPGGGFMYLGRWKWALAILGVALALGVVFAVFDLPEGIVRGASIGLAMASAMSARAEAKRAAEAAPNA